jgi:hypothetical protein
LQAPATQTTLLGQALLHAPQLFAFVSRSTHVPLHAVYPVAHTHKLFTHASFPPQRVLHRPQFVLSFVRSTHPPPQGASPSEHPAEHVPRLQTCPVAHPLLHEPQLNVLVCKLSQKPFELLPVPGQTVSPSGHTHAPFVQDPPFGQRVPQEPQSLLFVSKSTQLRAPRRPEHAVSPGAHPGAHCPLMH